MTSIDEFTELYEKAKTDHVLSFMYKGEEFSMGYASYLINVEFPKQQKHEEINSKRQESTCQD